MQVHIEREKRTEEIKFSGTVTELLKKIKVNPETVLVTRNGELLTTEELVSDKDKINILSVISGG